MSRCSSSARRALCTNTRRVVVQRCPAVPTAPNTMAGTARSRFAVSSTMTALLPPSSRRLFPSRAATRSPTLRPTAVEPVNETSATRGSSTNRVASSVPPSINSWNIGGRPWSANVRLQMCCTAIAVSGVLGEGFQTLTLPQIAARKAFHDQTATGKLNAEMIPTTPSGCHCSYMRCCSRSECIVRP